MALSVRSPWMFSRWIHDFAPLRDTRRYNPYSSVSFAGPFAVSILHTVSFAKVVPEFVPRIMPVWAKSGDRSSVPVRLINVYLS